MKVVGGPRGCRLDESVCYRCSRQQPTADTLFTRRLLEAGQEGFFTDTTASEKGTLVTQAHTGLRYKSSNISYQTCPIRCFYNKCFKGCDGLNTFEL